MELIHTPYMQHFNGTTTLANDLVSGRQVRFVPSIFPLPGPLALCLAKI